MLCGPTVDVSLLGRGERATEDAILRLKDVTNVRSLLIGPGHLSALLISDKRPDVAVAPLQKAIELASDCVPAHVNLAGAHSMQGNKAEALTSYRRAIELEPGNAETLTRLSAFLDMLGAVGSAAAKRARISAAMATVIMTLPAVERLVYDGKHVGPHPANNEPSPLTPLPAGEGDVRIAFVSPHCFMDFANGAATATRDGMTLLAGQGFCCEAFCGTRVDEAHQESTQETLARLGVPHSIHDARIGPFRGRMIFTSHGRVPVTLVDLAPGQNGSVNADGLGGPSYVLHREEIAAFLTGCEMFLGRFRPDVVVTYGGDPVSIAVQQLAKRCGAKIAFWLHNFAYGDRAAFALADHVIVGGEFSRCYYREKLGLDCHVLPYIVHWKEADVSRRTCPYPNPLPECEGVQRYVTFINPQETKGVFVFARIARELARRRPDIPILVTQGRSRGDALRNPALGLEPHIRGELQPEVDSVLACASGLYGRDGLNITTMPFTPDPQDFYPAVFARTKLLLMPSLWFESFGLVAAEAMLNGIPVLASNRGALPDTIGDGGFFFDIPARYTPESRDLPTAEEVEPWVETIIRLWDDAAEYDQCSRAARERAQAWHPDRLAPLYRDFFSRIVLRSAPALAPPRVVHR
jgi:glycosyltransferase involved in cell wall biosynthesis